MPSSQVLSSLDFTGPVSKIWPDLWCFIGEVQNSDWKDIFKIANSQNSKWYSYL